MRLDRNNGRGKYAVINLRKYADYPHLSGAVRPSPRAVVEAIETLEKAGLINYGAPNTEHEFFVMMLKDQFANDALHAYADAADQESVLHEDRSKSKSFGEYGDEVRELAKRSGAMSPWCKVPD